MVFSHNRILHCSSSQPGMILLLSPTCQGIFATSGDILGCHNSGVLLASSGLQIKDAINILQCKEENYPIQTVNKTEFEKFQPIAYENEL